MGLLIERRLMRLEIGFQNCLDYRLDFGLDSQSKKFLLLDNYIIQPTVATSNTGLQWHPVVKAPPEIS